jgi:hypothetical protein
MLQRGKKTCIQWTECVSQVMVAEERSRRKGIAAEALQLMMAYAIRSCNTLYFTAKIRLHNSASQALFAKLGFVKVKEVACFEEVHMAFSESYAPAQWAAVQALLSPPSADDTCNCGVGLPDEGDT